MQAEPNFVALRELLYADDTVLISSSRTNLKEMLKDVMIESAKYGLELNWSKLSR